tara:strand:- start:76 stop:615 length:540 start_codon:yes stop_codon:yes gene_type:complete
MLSKKIFIKKKSFLQKNSIIFLSALIILFLILWLNNLKEDFFIIPELSKSFYIIPKDKGGIKVINLDKKSLHPVSEEIPSYIKIINDPVLQYSIQVFSSDDYLSVKNKLDSLTKINYITNQQLDTNIKDFYIVVFNNDLGREYILLYKNFNTRDLAFDYCLKSVVFLKNCLIINAQNLY